jgi:hypothetical protein
VDDVDEGDLDVEDYRDDEEDDYDLDLGEPEIEDEFYEGD